MTVYANRIAKHADAVKPRNKAKAAKLQTMAKDKAVIAMLKANNVDPDRFENRALYATEKCVKIVHAVTRETVDISALNANAFATIKSAILAQKAGMTLTKRDIECSLSKDQVVPTERQAIVFRRDGILSPNTLAAQSQQCVDMLKTLGLVEEKAKNEFTIKDTPMMATFTEKFAELAA